MEASNLLYPYHDTDEKSLKRQEALDDKFSMDGGEFD
jgi:hypothetical protein